MMEVEDCWTLLVVTTPSAFTSLVFDRAFLQTPTAICYCKMKILTSKARHLMSIHTLTVWW